MDNIRQALERARARNFEGAGPGGYVPSEPLAYQFGREPPIEANLNDRSLKTTLVASHLEVNQNRRARRYGFSLEILRYIENSGSAGDGPEELENYRDYVSDAGMRKDRSCRQPGP